ncbi:MAG: hypothetical protein E7598_00315 [Ruminococcaceae bacterium]|nr:hypothetical protein [Oscillospiraceae bacterium]
MKNRTFAAFLCLLCIFMLCTVFAHAADRATLFIGDSEWENDSLLPFIETEGKMLLPASAFSALGKIKLTRSDTLGSLLFERDGAFLSYNLNFGTSLDENGVASKVNIYRYGGEIYLEPQPICEKFDLRFESEFAPDGYLAARISNSESTHSFSELLNAYSESGKQDIPFLYNPTGKTMAGAFTHPILLVPSPQNMALAINAVGNHRITFALAPDDIASYAKLIPTVYAKGHAVVYYMDSSLNSDTEAFRSSMARANEYLFSLVGVTSRVYVSAERYERIPKIPGYFAKACNIHLVVDDLRNNQMINFALYDSPNRGIYNFSLASDRQTRSYYSYFFNQFDRFEALRSMPLTESSSIN